MATLQMIFAILFFAVLHSIFARLIIKGWVKTKVNERVYEGFYRIIYTIFSFITLLPAAYILVAYSGRTIWDITGFISIIFRVIQFIGLIGLSVSLLQVELGRFAGFTQIRAYFNGQPLPLPPEPLNKSGMYALVRHPLYFFSMLLLWFTPNMSETSLVFVIATSLYFIFGSILEERTMLVIFGEEYRDYQKKVAWMVPFIK